MTRISLLRKTADWEAVRPDWAIYEHFFYNSAKEVHKVKGKIRIVDSIRLCGKKETVTRTRDVRWDGLGRCFVGTHNIRKRQYDIHFN